MIPTAAELRKGHLAYKKHEKRDAMYKIASFLVDHYWGKPADMADALGVLLLTWNQAFYRYGSFDFEKLEKCIAANLTALADFRGRTILGFSREDHPSVEKVFNDFLSALAIAAGSKKGIRSPVAVAKALHLLAPAFMPLWDDKIARRYGCHYAYEPASKYLCFMQKMKSIAEQVKGCGGQGGDCLLKLIDEYNYAKFTQEWI